MQLLISTPYIFLLFGVLLLSQMEVGHLVVKVLEVALVEELFHYFSYSDHNDQLK